MHEIFTSIFTMDLITEIFLLGFACYGGYRMFKDAMAMRRRRIGKK